MLDAASRAMIRLGPLAAGAALGWAVSAPALDAEMFRGVLIEPGFQGSSELELYGPSQAEGLVDARGGKR